MIDRQTGNKKTERNGEMAKSNAAAQKEHALR